MRVCVCVYVLYDFNALISALLQNVLTVEFIVPILNYIILCYHVIIQQACKFVLIYTYDIMMKIDESFEKFLKCNESKDLVNAYQMPTILEIFTIYYS